MGLDSQLEVVAARLLGSRWSVCIQVPYHPSCIQLLIGFTILVGFVTAACLGSARLLRRMLQKPQTAVRTYSSVLTPSPLTVSTGSDRHEDTMAYGDELLHDRRLRHRYRKLKRDWLQQGHALFKKLRSSKDRHSRKLEDGLESIYSPLAAPSTFIPSSRRASAGGGAAKVMSMDGAMAFRSIMESWRIIGGREVPLLMEMCRAASTKQLRAGETLFREGEPLQKCLYVLKEGAVDFVVAAPGEDGSQREEMFEAMNEAGTILAGIMDFIAILCDQTAAGYCATARCTRDSEIIRVPIQMEVSTLGAQSLCRLLRTCIIRSHRVTVLTAYSYLGIILDAYPELPVLPIPPKAQEVATTNDLTEDHQRALKSLVRSMLALEEDHPIEDITRYSPTSAILPTSPRQMVRSPPAHRSGRSKSDASETALSNLTLSTESSGTPRGSQPQPVRLLKLREGDQLHEVNDNSRTSLHLILTGELMVRRHEERKGKCIFSDDLGRKTITHGPGSVLGYGVVLTGAPDEWFAPRGTRPPLLNVSAAEETWVLQVQHSFIEQAMKVKPLDTTMLAAQKIFGAIPPILRLVDFGVKFRQLGAGEVLVREGDPSDGGLYVLLYGRCRSSVRDGNGKFHVVADHGRGTLIGEAEVFTGGCYKATVQAVRYTSFAVIPSSVLRLLVRRHPRVLSVLAEHVMDKAQRGQSTPAPGASRRGVVGVENAKTVLVLPVSTSVPLDLFCSRLEAALIKSRHTVRTVTSSTAASLLGTDEHISFSDDVDVLLLESWLTQQEEQHEVGQLSQPICCTILATITCDARLIVSFFCPPQIVLYRGDWQDSQWNHLVASMSDVVLLVANAVDSPQISFLEQKLEQQMRNAQKLFICLHVNPRPYYTPSGTRLWIEKRAGINQHYHVRLHTNSPSFDQAHIRSDFLRLSRILTGTAVGLVLGGGGAKGMAHLGVLRVLEEEGIPVDMIAGVSIGAFIGGLYAQRGSFLEILPHVNRFASSMRNVWLFIRDITLPLTSWFNGYSFSRAVEKAFGDAKIEDAWITFACLSVDLTVSKKRVHRNGTLWRYVRASMTLANLLPPLCDVDPKDDTVHFLVDGGYCDNCPCEDLKEMGAETIIAVDIGGEVRLAGREDYGDTLYGLQLLWNKRTKAPSMSEVSSQLMYVRSVESLERARGLIDFYLTPPVIHFSIMDFGAAAEIQSIGYSYAKEQVRAWKDALKKERDRERVRVPDRIPEPLDFKRGVSLTALDGYSAT